MPHSIVLIDDHQVLRDAIKEILVRNPEFQVVGEAGTGPDAIQVCRGSDPDLAVMDIGLPGRNGIEAIGELARHCPRTRVLIVSMYDDEDSVMAAVRAGARGFVLKKACALELADAVRTVACGGTYFGSQVSDRFLSGIRQSKRHAPARTTIESLTPREQQVLRLAVEGKCNKEVATLLNLEVHTVRSYRKSLMAKLGAGNIAELIQISAAAGFVERDKAHTRS